MIVNFRIYKINRDTRKLTPTPILIKKKIIINYFFYFVYTDYNYGGGIECKYLGE